MKLYFTTWDRSKDGVQYEFVGTQADHKALEKKVKHLGIDRSEAVEVPVDKAGMIKWLNTFRFYQEEASDDTQGGQS